MRFIHLFQWFGNQNYNFTAWLYYWSAVLSGSLKHTDKYYFSLSLMYIHYIQYAFTGVLFWLAHFCIRSETFWCIHLYWHYLTRLKPIEINISFPAVNWPRARHKKMIKQKLFRIKHLFYPHVKFKVHGHSIQYFQRLKTQTTVKKIQKVDKKKSTVND